MEDEFTLGSGFGFEDSSLMFLVLMVGLMTVWCGWSIYSFFRTYREDRNGQYGLYDMTFDVMKAIALWTIVLAFVIA